jgi:hypothetical protein
MNNKRLFSAVAINSTTGECYIALSMTSLAKLINVDRTTIKRHFISNNKWKKYHWLIFFNPNVIYQNKRGNK